MLDLSHLSLEQRQAVLAGDGPLLIVAGPGSGKTTVLAARIAYLVLARHVAPASVLAITFSTKAAHELRARLEGILGEAGQAVDVTTFHAFGLRIIRQWGEKLGFVPGPIAVYSDEEARLLLRYVAQELSINLDQYPLSDLSVRVNRYRLQDRHAPTPDHIPRLAEAYDILLKQRQAIDFPAMLALPLQLFDEQPEVLRLFQDAYRYILCDEFQDVCAAQYDLLRRLVERHTNLVVVGDPCQTLYAWRGADIRFLRDFKRDFPTARLISLYHNFRSTRGIIAIANALGALLPYSQPMQTDNPSGIRGRLYIAADECAEASFVAHEITRLWEDQHVKRLGEVAVLYRTNQQAQALTLALRSARLPYAMRGHSDLFERREVRDAIAYLSLAHNPADRAALLRIVNVPPRRLGRLVNVLQDHPAPIHTLPALANPYGSTAMANAEALVTLLEHLHGQSTQLPLHLLLDLVLEASGYRGWLAAQSDGPACLRHLGTFRHLLEQSKRHLGLWLAEMRLGEDTGVAPDDAERVVLTTIHGAKGGEWRVVFVVGVEEGLLPHARLHDGQPLAATRIEEELRVAYVAVTRPRERLYLTCCRVRQYGATRVLRQPSRFLHGLPLDVLDGAA